MASLSNITDDQMTALKRRLSQAGLSAEKALEVIQSQDLADLMVRTLDQELEAAGREPRHSGEYPTLRELVVEPPANSVRILNSLRGGEITTVEQLLQKREADLLSLNGFSYTSLKQLNRRLRMFGLHLHE